MHTTKALGMGPLPAMVEDQAGFPAIERAFKGSGLPLGLLDDLNTRVPLQSLQTLFEIAAREVGDEYFGLRVGLRMDSLRYGNWGRYVSGGRTLAGSLRRMNRTSWLHQSGTHLFLQRQNEHVVWKYKRESIDAETCQQHSLHVLPTLVSLVRIFLGQTWLPSWIEFEFAEPARPRPIEEAFPVEAHYGRTALGIAIPRASLSATPVSSLDLGHPVTYADLVAAETFFGKADLRDISGLIGMRLLEGHDDIDGLAQRLGVGPRTLQRRLSAGGCSYRALLERAKVVRAMSLLRETDMTIIQIALALGYEEPGNFSRAFRRSVSCTPTEFRSRWTSS